MGFDASKLLQGCKRLVLANTLSNVLASRIVLASAVDEAAAIACWDEVAAVHDLLG